MNENVVPITAKPNSPYFTTGREKIFRSNKDYVGHDVIYREDDNLQLGVVSKDYSVISHREAIQPVEDALNLLGLKHRFDFKLDRGGAKMFARAHMIDAEFDPASVTGIPNTAFNGKTNQDIFTPMIRVQNAYDKSRPFAVDFGVLRLWCLNGAVVYHNIERTTIKHIGDVNLDKIGDFIHRNIAATIKGMSDFYVKANQTSGHDILQQLIISQEISERIKKLTVLELSGFGKATYSMTGEKRKTQKLESFEPSEEFSMYLLYNLLTKISSHESRSGAMREGTDNQIAKLFEV